MNSNRWAPLIILLSQELTFTSKLMMKATASILQSLLHIANKYNFDVNMENNKGLTALHCLVESGYYELVTYFADVKTDIHLKTSNGSNFLHIAALYRHLNLCKTLLDEYKFDVNMADKGGWRALHYSSRNGNYKFIRYFNKTITDIDLKGNSGFNCLRVTTLNEHSHLYKTLVDEQSSDINKTDNFGWTTLQFSLENVNYELIGYFVDMGIANEKKYNFGSNCLYIAPFHGNLNICKASTNRHYFNVYFIDNDKWAAGHDSSGSGSYKLIKYFAEMGILGLKLKLA